LDYLSNFTLLDRIANRFDPGHKYAVLALPVFPICDETRHYSIGGSAHPAAGGIYNAITEKIQNLPVTIGHADFLGKNIMAADGSDLLVESGMPEIFKIGMSVHTVLLFMKLQLYENAGLVSNAKPNRVIKPILLAK
jgi:hypothetical protein